MIILGLTNDDKGAQLESLTKRVLSMLGYEDINLNLVSAGGDEIDVHAKLNINVPGGVSTFPVVCECKAYRSALDINHWLKFLGKLFLERKRHSGNSIGILVALNGCNGNVLGSYREIRNSDDNVFIYTGKDIEDNFVQSKVVLSREEAAEVYASTFKTSALEMELSYYNGSFYWISYNEDEKYVLIDQSRAVLTSATAQGLVAVLNASGIRGELVDSDEDQRVRIRMHNVKLAIVNHIYKDGFYHN